MVFFFFFLPSVLASLHANTYETTVITLTTLTIMMPIMMLLNQSQRHEERENL